MFKPNYLEKLPNFIDFFFALIAVAGFVLAASHFGLATSPQFEGAQDRWVLIAFVVAYFFIVGDWLFYRKLIADSPYRNLGRFFIDAFLVFPLMFALLHFAFLAGDKGRFHFYIFTLAMWHFSVMLWHLALRWESGKGLQREESQKLKSSIKAHIKRWAIYAILGGVYLCSLSSRWVALSADTTGVVLRIVTLALVVTFTSVRIYTFFLGRELPKWLRRRR